MFSRAIKSWDLKQLPSFEAIEEPQDKSEDEDEDEENSDTKKKRYNKIKYRKKTLTMMIG